MAHRGIATLAAALMLCFLLLSHFEPEAVKDGSRSGPTTK